jgi:hypothetical protein
VDASQENHPEVLSGITDLRDVPLSLISAVETGDILRYVLPETSGVGRVSVAAFNSSI